MQDSSLRLRWLILLILGAALLVGAPEPIDVVAVKTLYEGTLLAAPSSPTRDADIPTLLKSGARRQEAEAAFHRVIERRHLDPQPWRKLGELYAAWGRPDDALYAYSQAIHRGDAGAALDRSLAQLYATLGDSRRAAHHWGNYLSHHADDRSARLALVWTSIQLADWERARIELEGLLTVDPSDAVAHAWLGLLLIGPDPTTGRYHLQRAAEDPAIAEVLAPVFTAERLSAAVDDPAYRLTLLGVSFLDLDITTLPQPFALGASQLGSAIENELWKATATLALRSFLAAAYRSPAYAEAYAYLGQALDQLGWSGWARAALQHALRLAPQSPVVQTLMGLYWDRRGAPTLARHYYEVAYKQDRENASLCLEIAGTYLAEREYTAAEVWLLYAVDIAPDDPVVWETLTRFYLDLGIGAGESGLKAARRFLELAPDSAYAHDLMGWAYFLNQDYALAETSFAQALALDPSLASTYYHLGRLNAYQGRYPEASQNYRRAADYDVDGKLTAQLKRAWEELPQAYQ